jgi:prefoldin alpha subunit
MAESKHNEKEAQLAYRAQLLDQQLRHLRTELERIMLVLVELEKAKTAMQESKEEGEFTFQLGAGIMAKAMMQDEKFLVPIGGNYYIEMDKESSVKKIEDSIEKTRDYYDKINGEVKKAEQNLITIMKEARGAA